MESRGGSGGTRGPLQVGELAPAIPSSHCGWPATIYICYDAVRQSAASRSDEFGRCSFAGHANAAGRPRVF